MAAFAAGARVRLAPVPALLAVALLLAGCGAPAGRDPDPVSFAFDGAGAHAVVAAITTEPDGSAQPRVPGTPLHAKAAAELWEAMQVDGWTVRWQNFTGSDYLALPHGGVAAYVDSPTYCTGEARERAASLGFANLVATWDGGNGTGRFWLGAHWDSKRHATQDPDAQRRLEPVVGANDGASGVGILVQLMRHVAAGDVRPAQPLGIVFFDGEDGFEDCHPLAGSLWFVAHRDAAGLDAERFLLLDMVGDPGARFVRDAHSMRCARALVDLLWERAPHHGLGDNFVGRTASVADDHLPFVEAGIPAVDIIDLGRPPGQGQGGFPPYWHTTGDTLDKVDAAMLGRVGGLVADIVDEPGPQVACPR